MSTLRVYNIENPSTAAGGIGIATDGSVTVGGLQYPTAGPLSNRNLIINGAMQVAQRATLVEDQSASAFHTVDRMAHSEFTATAYTFDQEQSTDAPAGFAYSFKNTTATALTETADSEIRALRYKIEGQDLQHLNYGTASAQTITLSFWVKTNVQGTYVVRFVNNDDTQSRRFAGQYTIANDQTGTWQYRTITVVGDTNTAIANSNENEFDIFFVTDAGSNRLGGTANQWDDFVSADAAPGQTAFVGRTVSAYWQITGVQLEVGSKATPFEHRSYGDELQRCMRYYQEYTSSTNGLGIAGAGYVETGTQTDFTFFLSTPMRTLASANITEIGDLEVRIGGNRFDVTGLTSVAFNDNFSLATTRVTNVDSSASAGTVARLRANGAGAGFSFNAEL